ncbi:MAG: hypothetical protein KC519_01570 [Anaerolineae bacterium]|nr:hypothetical protein [Anaerolineae bacterium]
MHSPIQLTLPPHRPKRRHIFTIRLTDAERAELKGLAQQLQFPDSSLARHFILEAVAYHRTGAEVTLEA